MLLYLVRHGLASWPQWDGPDDERPLNPQGVEQVRAQGQALARLGVRPDAVLHSPLVRARQTAELLAEALGVWEELREEQALCPGFSPAGLKQILRARAGLAGLMMVGHAPDMGHALHRLTGAAARFPEGTVAAVKADEPEKAASGTLLWLAPPGLFS